MERLKTDPVFGITVPNGCQGLFDATNGDAVANDQVKFRRILADMIPERTLPAGGAGGSGVAGEPDEDENPMFDVVPLFGND